MFIATEFQLRVQYVQQKRYRNILTYGAKETIIRFSINI